MDLSIENVAWFAGLFEGEGCFFKDWRKRSTSKRGTVPQYTIKIKMTDKDVIDKLHRLFGGNIYVDKKQSEHHKQPYSWYLCRKADVERLITAALPFFGDRRAHRALDKLDLIDYGLS